MHRYKVTFVPSERVSLIEEGETLLDAAMKADVHINASCGGNGSCGKCRVKVVKGNVLSSPDPNISAQDYDSGYRLACKSRVSGNVLIDVPFESQVDRVALRRKPPRPHILSSTGWDHPAGKWQVDPLVIKVHVQLPVPSIDDNIGDVERLLRELRKREIIDISVDFRAVTSISEVLRSENWSVTATLVRHKKGGYRLAGVEPGNREKAHHGIAIDIGTTTVCGQLLDLSDADKGPVTLAELSDYNGQIRFGEDVISRIMYTRKKGGLKRLQEAVVHTVNGVIKELLDTAGMDGSTISHLVIAGNTTMTHIVCGLDPRYIMLSPYTPAATFLPPVRTADLGVRAGHRVDAHFVPCVSSYIGGDIVAGVLGSGMVAQEKLTLFMDIGTNGEIVLGNADWLVCASCSAGPAFEGGGIAFGMRAQKGAIEQVRINPLTYEPMILTIGRVKPMGICGSGLIDGAAELFFSGIIDQNGRFVRNGATERVRKGESGYEYVLAYSNETGIGRDIVLTEVDLENLIRTKAAIYAGCRVLLDMVGLTFKDVATIIIAGGFGHYIDVEKAQAIGLLPEMPVDKFLFVGNGSLLGARLVSSSRGFMDEVGRIARMMTNVELSGNAKFMDEFVAASFLPHTDHKAFPKVFRNLKKEGGAK